MRTRTSKSDVAPVDAAEVVTILFTAGVFFVVFGLIAAYEATLFNTWPQVILLVGALCLVGGLIVKGVGPRS